MTWTNVRRLDSSEGTVWKYVFESRSAVAEAVLYRYPTFEKRTVICCSTQSGCPVGCRFCGAGDKFVRSLTTDEIVGQIQHLLADKSIDTTKVERFQIMFMSMGEPLLNQPALFGALRRLHELYPEAALLISTSAPDVDYEALRAISVEIPKVGLQFSVHESTDWARDKLIPFARKLRLEQIAREGVLWAHATGRRPFINYCAHEGNSTDADAWRLAVLFDPTIFAATVSVVCEREENVKAARERQKATTQAFLAKLQKQGFFDVRVFDPAGQDDIGGGCGQLWYVQDWMRKHPEFVSMSAGFRRHLQVTEGIVGLPRTAEYGISEAKAEATPE